MKTRIGRMSFAAAAALCFAENAQGEEALTYVGAEQFQPTLSQFSVTGATPAAEVVRGCPGFMPEAPMATVAVSQLTDLARAHAIGEGLAGVMVETPDGVYGCARAGIGELATYTAQETAEGDYRVWPLTVEAGAVVDGWLLVSDSRLSLRDIGTMTGIAFDPSIVPPLIGDEPLAPDAEPAFGRIALPETGAAIADISISALVPASDARGHCNGLIDQKRPDVTLDLAEGAPVLSIIAEAVTDTTLLVIGPEDYIACNDDAIDSNPGVLYENAPAGRYAIWVGAFDEANAGPARVIASRETMGLDPTPKLGPDAPPAHGRIELPAEGDAHVAFLLEGVDAASYFSSDCFGLIDARRPDAVISLPVAEATLYIGAQAEEIDTTLMVVTPSGEMVCGDDYAGMNPGLVFGDAEAGDYKVWVGAYEGGAGAQAALFASRTPQAPEEIESEPETIENPFKGVELTSAAQVMDILLEDLGLAGEITYEAREETGPDGFVLTGVTMTTEPGEMTPLHVGSIRVSDLDLDALSRDGSFDSFVLTMENIDYAALAMLTNGAEKPIFTMDNPPPLTVTTSSLPPDGDESRRVLETRIAFGDRLEIDLEHRVIWPEATGSMDPIEAAMTIATETVDFTMTDKGFLGPLLAQIAASTGTDYKLALEDALSELFFAMGETPEESYPGQFKAALDGKMRDFDGDGVLHMSLSAKEAVPSIQLFMLLGDDAASKDAFDFSATYEPAE